MINLGIVLPEISIIETLLIAVQMNITYLCLIQDFGNPKPTGDGIL